MKIIFYSLLLLPIAPIVVFFNSFHYHQTSEVLIAGYKYAFIPALIIGGAVAHFSWKYFLREYNSKIYDQLPGLPQTIIALFMACLLSTSTGAVIDLINAYTGKPHAYDAGGVVTESGINSNESSSLNYVRIYYESFNVTIKADVDRKLDAGTILTDTLWKGSLGYYYIPLR